MTDQEINQAIAEACGWRFDPEWAHKWDSRGKWCESPNGDRVFVHGIPNYCNDLNAMHEAEQVLRGNQFHFVDYTRILWRLLAGEAEYGKLGYFAFDFVTATARQRAEAFLRTIGKWRDE